MFNRTTNTNETKTTSTTTPIRRNDRVNGLLDKGCSFEGKLTFDGTVQINGDFTGEILSDGILVIGTDATVSAKIMVDTAIIHGKFEGQIEAKTKIELHVPAVVNANIKTKSMSVEDGVIFQGTCQMDRKDMASYDKLSANGHANLPTDDADDTADVLVM